MLIFLIPYPGLVLNSNTTFTTSTNPTLIPRERKQPCHCSWKKLFLCKNILIASYYLHWVVFFVLESTWSFFINNLKQISLWLFSLSFCLHFGFFDRSTSRVLPKRTCIFSLSNVQIIYWKVNYLFLYLPTLLINTSFALLFDAVSVCKIIAAAPLFVLIYDWIAYWMHFVHISGIHLLF